MSDDRLDIRSIKLHGRPVSYVQEGDGPVLLLIHGMAGTLHNWQEVIAPLARELHRHRARPARPRHLRGQCRRLLARGARRRASRSSRRSRPRTRDARRPFAGGRDRDAVLLPVPRDDRAARARVQRRARSRGQPDPSCRIAPRGRPRHRGHRRAGQHRRGRGRARSGDSSGCVRAPTVAEVARGYASLVDRDRRDAFLGTLRGVVGTSGQRIQAGARSGDLGAASERRPRRGRPRLRVARQPRPTNAAARPVPAPGSSSPRPRG